MQGHIYTPLAVLVIGRDVFLVAGAFFLRFRSCNYQWPGWREFFRTTNEGLQSPVTVDLGRKQGVAESSDSAGSSSAATEGSSPKPAPFVQPLYISKVNTVVQICLVSCCLTVGPLGWPPESVILCLGGATGALTLASGFAYFQKHR